MTTALALDVVLPAVDTALRNGAAGALTPEVALDRALTSLRCADLTTLPVRCLACGNGASFDPELGTILCGVGCGQPARGDATATVRDRWVDVTHRAQAPDASFGAFAAERLAEEYASARLVDGDTEPGPHIHRA